MLQFTITNLQLPITNQLSMINGVENGKRQILNALKTENCELKIETTERSAR